MFYKDYGQFNATCSTIMLTLVVRVFEKERNSPPQLDFNTSKHFEIVPSKPTPAFILYEVFKSV